MSKSLEEIVVDAVIKGVSESSMLASSLAIRISKEKEVLDFILQNLDYETLARYMAKEIVRLGNAGRAGSFSYTSFMKKAQDEAHKLLLEEMARELAFPDNKYKRDQLPVIREEDNE